MGFSLAKKTDQPIEKCYSGMVRKIQIITCRKLLYVIMFLRKRKVRVT